MKQPFFVRDEYSDSLRRTQNTIIAASQSYNVAIGLTGGNFLIGLFLLMESDNSVLGLVSIITLIASLAQAFSPFVLERIERKKQFLIASRAVNNVVCILLIGAVPFLPAAPGIRHFLLLAALFISNMCAALTSPGFTAWHVGLIPKERQVDYFSITQMMNIIVQTPLLLGAGWIIDALKDNGYALAGFTVVRLLAGIFFLLDILLISKLPPPSDMGARELSGFWSTLKEPLGNRRFMACVVIGCVVSFSNALQGPYRQAYLLDSLGMSFTYLNLIGLIGTPAVLIFAPFWRRAVKRLGWQRVGFSYMLILSLPYLCFGFMGEETKFIYPVGAIIEQSIAPASIAFNVMIFEFLPRRNQTGFLGFNIAIGTVSALLGSAAGRIFMMSTGKTLLLPGFAPIDNSRALMLICCFSHLLSGVICLLICKKVGWEKADL